MSVSHRDSEGQITYKTLADAPPLTPNEIERYLKLFFGDPQSDLPLSLSGSMWQPSDFPLSMRLLATVRDMMTQNDLLYADLRRYDAERCSPHPREAANAG